jgi:3-dehydroquinate dehydratase-1
MAARPIELPGRETRMPVVCAPLVGRTHGELMQEARVVVDKRPDLVEWRADFFDEFARPDRVAGTAAALREVLRGIPLLFTRRSALEGGHASGGTDAQAVAAIEAVCVGRCAEMVDWEMDRDAAHLARVRAATTAAGAQLLLSFHDFHSTPPQDVLVARFRKARSLGGDIAKLAVMPRDMQDVLTLLAATQEASSQLDFPLVSMAMGPLGAVTRACGWAFGSAMTFAIGASSSAPGQMAIEDVRLAVGVLQRASS